MLFTTVFFDLDDTLYPNSSGLWSAIKTRIGSYMHELLGIPAQDIPILREQYFRKYGTTLRGLEANYSIDRKEYLAYVHDLPLAEYIGPDVEQRAVIRSIPARKLIFTNADAAHAQRVLSVLRLEDCFEAIVDINAMMPFCKPQRETFNIALETAGEVTADHCALVDDLQHTTRAALEYGFFSILFGGQEMSDNANAVLKRWPDLPGLLEGKAL
ncbi:MAG: pyrimidine 5'-nucleotidase [Anaerolineales bacterium]|nr:pyrimidine 5'-nucleotidase [Anaerolineales bacterium]